MCRATGESALIYGRLLNFIQQPHLAYCIKHRASAYSSAVRSAIVLCAVCVRLSVCRMWYCVRMADYNVSRFCRGHHTRILFSFANYMNRISVETVSCPEHRMEKWCRELAVLPKMRYRTRSRRSYHTPLMRIDISYTHLNWVAHDPSFKVILFLNVKSVEKRHDPSRNFQRLATFCHHVSGLGYRPTNQTLNLSFLWRWSLSKRETAKHRSGGSLSVQLGIYLRWRTKKQHRSGQRTSSSGCPRVDTLVALVFVWTAFTALAYITTAILFLLAFCCLKFVAYC